MCTCNSCNKYKPCDTPCRHCVVHVFRDEEPVDPGDTNGVTTTQELNICGSIFPAGSILTEVLAGIVEAIICGLPEPTEDIKVKSSSTDNVSGYLQDKLKSGISIEIKKYVSAGTEHLRANLLLSPNPGNSASIDGSGKLFVPTYSFTETPNSKVDSNSIKFALNGAFNRNISANLKIDPLSTAPISITSGGLRVDCCQTVPVNQLTVTPICTSSTGELEMQYEVGGPCNPGSIYNIEVRDLPSGTFTTLVSNITCNNLPYKTSFPYIFPLPDKQFRITQTVGGVSGVTLYNPTKIICEDPTPICLPPIGLNVNSIANYPSVDTTITWTTQGTPTATFLNVNGTIYNVSGLNIKVISTGYNQTLNIAIYNECGELNSNTTTTTHTTPEQPITTPENLVVTTTYNDTTEVYDVLITWLVNSVLGVSELRINNSYVGEFSGSYTTTAAPGETVSYLVRNVFPWGVSPSIYTTVTMGYPECLSPEELELELEADPPYGGTRLLTIDWNSDADVSNLIINSVNYGNVAPPFYYNAVQNGEAVNVTVQNICVGGISASVSDSIIVPLEEVCPELDVNLSLEPTDFIVDILNIADPRFVDYTIEVTGTNLVTSPEERVAQTASQQTFALIDGPGTVTTYYVTIVMTCTSGGTVSYVGTRDVLFM